VKVLPESDLFAAAADGWLTPVLGAGGIVLVAVVIVKLYRRVQLSLAKHPSLRGHARWSRRLARLIPYYAYDENEFFGSDDVAAEIVARRQEGFTRLSTELKARWPSADRFAEALDAGLSDVCFTKRYRVPFQFREKCTAELPTGTLVTATRGVQVCDVDGNWDYDLTGAYGVNVFGYDFYKECLEEARQIAGPLGPVLGPYHPAIVENVRRLREISGLDEVSFHMSGTEAVMQAVRLARFHSGRTHVALFCGAYHGWWDGVQPGIGNQRVVTDVYMLSELSEATLRVLDQRTDIACVLVNPLQAMHPNGGAPSDTTLVDSSRKAAYDKTAYAQWLARLREVCTRRGIVLIFDEVFVGFRLARGGAQEYFGVQADIVTYGKTLGGGLPVGVVCGRHSLMRRFVASHPSRISFARGTFNSHPWVMAAMQAFLRRIEEPEVAASWASIDELWNARAKELNRRLAEADLPARVVNLASIWTVVYTQPSRYNWMLQYYLRAEGLLLSWVGTGRLIFSHNYTDADFEEVCRRFVSAAQRMVEDGWWCESPLDDRAIRRRILGEIVQTLIGRRPGSAAAAVD